MLASYETNVLIHSGVISSSLRKGHNFTHPRRLTGSVSYPIVKKFHTLTSLFTRLPVRRTERRTIMNIFETGMRRAVALKALRSDFTRDKLLSSLHV